VYASSYQLQVAVTPLFGGSTIYTRSTSFLSLTEHASEDGKFYWRIRTKNQFGELGEWSNVWSFTTDSDYDGDRLYNSIESQLGTDPWNPDSDFDTLEDGDEVLVYHTNPLKWDHDGDGLSDGSEVHIHHTDPLDDDDDGDGMPDGWEVDYDFNPLYYFDGKLDADGDGLRNRDEYDHGTNPRWWDTDGDEISDGDEVNLYGTNPLDDSDTLTPEGKYVKITDDNTGISLTFQYVDDEGVTTIEIVKNPPNNPSGFVISGLPGALSITTTVTFSGYIIIEIPYDDTGVKNEASLRLLHYDSVTRRWVDVTLLPVDEARNIIRGKIKSFSTFAIMEPAIDNEIVLSPNPYYCDINDNIYITPDTTFTLSEVGTVHIFDIFYYRINESEWVEYTEPFIVQGLDGQYIVEYYGEDSEGNAGIQQKSELMLVNLEISCYL